MAKDRKLNLCRILQMITYSNNFFSQWVREKEKGKRKKQCYFTNYIFHLCCIVALVESIFLFKQLHFEAVAWQKSKVKKSPFFIHTLYVYCTLHCSHTLEESILEITFSDQHRNIFLFISNDLKLRSKSQFKKMKKWKTASIFFLRLEADFFLALKPSPQCH